MTVTENRIATSEPRIRRRRHARHTQPNWVKRAGVAGGVLGVAALTTAAAPASADTGRQPNVNEVTQTLDLSQLRAADATSQAAVNYELQAAQAQASADALKAAQQQKAADAARAAAEKAAQQRADAAKAAAQKAAQQAKSTVSSASSSISSAASSVSSASGSVASIISFLQAQIGKPYVYGSTGPDSYDCSGLTQAAFKSIGVDLPRTSQDQSDTGTPVSLSSLQPGDLLFWGGQGSAYHVGVYVGNGNFIAAENPSTGIVEKPLSYSEPDFATRVG